MGIKKVKPTTPGRRNASFDDFADITSTKPVKGLSVGKKQKAGRNNTGRITIRHRGGGVKRKIRIMDYKREKFGVPATVKTIEYDPNRGARISLLFYADGEKRYIVTPTELKVGDVILSSRDKIEIKNGNCMPVKHIPAGIPINSIEMEPGKGAKIVRGAGNSAFVMGVEKKYAQIKLPSGEIRLIKAECLCTIGQISNPDKKHIKLGSAGRRRKMGWRPTVRGSAMNPVDHPHGGGEGNQPIGMKHPKTPWGKPALGVKTRKKDKASNKFIIQRRKNKKK